MGKGDKKTKRGKIFMGSFGNTRKRKVAKTTAPADQSNAAPKEDTKRKVPRKRERPVKEG